MDRLGTAVRCIRYDRRSYGETEYSPEDGWSPVADTVAVLDASEADTVIAIGSSIGGRTAIDLALAHPERISALVLIAPAISGAPEPELEPLVEALDAEIDAADAVADLDAVNRLEAHLWFDGPGHEGRVNGPIRDLFLDMNARAISAIDPGTSGDALDAWSRLDRITVPILFLVGSLDLLHIRERAREAAASVQNGQFVELPDSAHLPHLEGSPSALDAIAEFLALRG
ncbi:alpha/beta fold hydrolase [Microbacterium murale]|uniref:alpha/beta fold hydrolase n=1 Tax=Microbacterium murale TaxID=1081040 RepID=UPI0027D85B8B|nr:alpha/beta hydrolase [Microbacterium murale]